MFSRRFFDVQATFSLPTSAARKKHDDTSRDMLMYTVSITGNFNLDRNDISEVHVNVYIKYVNTCLCMFYKPHSNSVEHDFRV